MFLQDRVSISKPRKTEDGYLVAQAKVARTGIQEYLASELGLTDRAPNSVVRLYRPPEEVFSDATMRTFAHRPMTLGHPSKMVDASTWKSVAVGQTGGEVIRDGDYVQVPLVLMDAQAIAQVEAGIREFSMGYTAEIVFQDGQTPDGERYDAIQTQIRNNHLALVDQGRAGHECRIGDKETGSKPKTPQEKVEMTDNLHTVVLGDKAVHVAATDAPAVEAFKAAAAQALTDAAKVHDAAIAAKDAEIAKKDAEIADLKSQVVDGKQLDALVAARSDLLTKAKSIAAIDYAGMSDAEIRKAAVTAKLGAKVVDGKSDAYIEARFDAELEKAPGTDSTTNTVVDMKALGDAHSKAYQQMVANLNQTTEKH